MIGIVGKPNVGKSTFFNSITLSNAEVASYPFTTIDSNIGIAYATKKCVCKDLGVSCGKCVNGTRFIPVKVIDVAGLVPDAHKGRGLGNRFLDDISKAQVLIHIVDASGTTDEEGRPTKGYNPLHDIEFLEREIDFWFFSKLEEKWGKIARRVQQEDIYLHKILPEKFGLLSEEEVLLALHETSLNPEKPSSWSREEFWEFVKALRRINKPIVVAANKSDIAPKENLKWLKEKGILVCAEAELALKRAEKASLIKYVSGDKSFEVVGNLSKTQKIALEKIQNYLEKFGSTGVQECINKAVFDVLDLIVVFPVENETHFTDTKGNVLPDAFLMKRGATVHDLAYKIHTEIGEKFIYALNARTKMRVREDYELQDCDVIKIVSAAK